MEVHPQKKVYRFNLEADLQQQQQWLLPSKTMPIMGTSYTISADDTDTALILTFKQPGDAALRKLEKWGDYATNLSTIQNGSAANGTSDNAFEFLAAGAHLHR